MRFDQVGAQLPQRPTAIGLAHLTGRLLRQLHDAGFVAGGQPRGCSRRLQLLDGLDPGRCKGVQVRVDGIDMHALRRRNSQRAQAHAIEQQGLRPALLVAIDPTRHQFTQLANLARARATDVQWTRHGVASSSEARHSNND
jgi:hypothetical protein